MKILRQGIHLVLASCLPAVDLGVGYPYFSAEKSDSPPSHSGLRFPPNHTMIIHSDSSQLSSRIIVDLGVGHASSCVVTQDVLDPGSVSFATKNIPAPSDSPTQAKQFACSSSTDKNRPCGRIFVTVDLGGIGPPPRQCE